MMKKTFTTIISLFVCLAHTGLCFAFHSPLLLKTRNWQLETDGGSPLWKGGGGNAAGGLSLTYDSLGRLLTDGEALTCTYDALGNRLQTVGCCSITPEIWVPNHADPLKRPLMMYDAEEDEVYYYYIWGGNRLLGVIENGEFWDESDTLFVAHSDEIGSVIALTDLSGTPLYSANYGPHGEDWGSTGFNPTPFTWLGGYGVYTLETGTPLKLYLTRYRVYSATLNRFLSADPMGLEGGLNLYAYGEGNPMAYIDPLGLCPQNQSYGLDLGSPFGPSHAMPDVSKYGIFSVLAPATFTGTTAYQDHYNSYTLPMLQTIASGYSAMTTIASVQQGLMVDALLPAAATRAAVTVTSQNVNPVAGLERVGSALKTDAFHAFPNVVDNFASSATKTPLSSGANLYQASGSLNGTVGRFEWIIQNDQVTHRLFVPNGTLNGIPIKP